jgi:hypothetical protein
MASTIRKTSSLVITSRVQMRYSGDRDYKYLP